jgi:anti-sigma regulatory factor (Ser/Thr protein kinase)
VQRLRLPAREDSLQQFRQFALNFAARAGLDQTARQRVELVLEEALVNVIRYAYAGAAPDAERPVELACATDPDGVFRMTLTDWGAPFDPVAPTHPLAPDEPLDTPVAELEATLLSNLEADLDHRALGGMGLFLISNMSEAAYARRGEANELSLRFNAAEA